MSAIFKMAAKTRHKKKVHGARKERRIIIIIIRNGAKTISLQTLFGRFNEHNRLSNITLRQTMK
jgi:hypothetical protein